MHSLKYLDHEARRLLPALVQPGDVDETAARRPHGALVDHARQHLPSQQYTDCKREVHLELACPAVKAGTAERPVIAGSLAGGHAELP